MAARKAAGKVVKEGLEVVDDVTKGFLERAKDILDDALIIANQENDDSVRAGINTIYGIINVRWGKFDKAIKFFESALEQRTKEKNWWKKWSFGSRP